MKAEGEKSQDESEKKRKAYILSVNCWRWDASRWTDIKIGSGPACNGRQREYYSPYRR